MKFVPKLLAIIALILTAEIGAQTPSSEPKLVDEIGMTSADDWEARIDIFAYRLMKDVTAVGLIRTYGPGGKGIGTADGAGNQIREFMVSEKGVNPERIKVVNGGRYKEIGVHVTEFWLLGDENDIPPRRLKFESPAFTVKGKLAQKEVLEDFGSFWEGPGWSPSYSILAGIADVMEVQPGTRLYLVMREGEERIPGRWKRLADREKREIESRGVLGSRIETIYAGTLVEKEKSQDYPSYNEIEYWILPEGSEPPAKTVQPAPPTKRAFDLADYYGSPDRAEEEELMKAIGDALKAFPDFKVSFVVRKPSGIENSKEDHHKIVLDLPEHLKRLLIEKGVDSSRIGSGEIPTGEIYPLIVHIVLHPKDESPLDSLDI
ncbi:MAG TPA: hypothetical protein VMM38_14455 [Aridibacter sp.]|nr:hypothetical protein [Aridibacter sp.]